ncbi:MAG: PorV/PorQ family protein [Candidatus Cloacimonetes bacterium]|nr:PorV/PorQ family protein [Candidatus Cloacimonadota bacterium]
MFKRHIVVISLLAMLGLPFALAGISQGSLLFLTFEPGGRANGMGRAYSAVADDAYAMWWNPGATAFNRKTQLAGTHIPWLQGSGLDDMFYEFLGWNQYFYGIGNLNAHVIWLDAGTQPHTGANQENYGDFHSFDVAGAVGYSYELVPEKVGVGGNFKLLYSYLAPGTGATDGKDGSAFSFAFDLGAKFQDIGLPGIDGSIVLQNIGPDVTFVDQDQADPAPVTFRLGGAYTLFDNPMNKMIVSAEASKMLTNSDPLWKRFATGWENFDETIYAVGAEYTYLELIALRGGYFNDSAGEVTGPSFGVGVQYRFDQRYKLSADFAMVPAGGLVDYNKIFSLGFEF